MKRQSNVYTDYSGVKSDQHSSNKRSVKDLIKEQFQNQNLRNDSTTEEKPAVMNQPFMQVVINTQSSNDRGGFGSPKFGEHDRGQGVSGPPKINHLVNSGIASSEDNITNDNPRDQGSMH